MKKPASPADEQARLDALESLSILDTQPEEKFDRLTRLAKRLFDVPIALITLVDEDRQWFKSRQGLSETQTPREISFCGHAILGDDPFVVTDTTTDERFADNPLVTGEPRIRFYAGCPLTSRNGSKLGTLCVIDREPRSFDQDDLEALVDLAGIAESEFATIEMATTDQLTGIANRRGFMMLGKQSLRLCEREKIPASLVFIDLDDFKPINDDFGHAEGDRVLQTFARELGATSRDADIIARLGGDEFVVLLVNVVDGAAEEFISRFRKGLEKFDWSGERGYEVSFSCGIVDFDPDKHPSLDALLAAGDDLMYETKHAKR